MDGMRPTRTETMFDIARVIATRGTCDRKQVGAVIAIDGRPISWGYNGAPPGLPHCDENHHGWLGQQVIEEYDGRAEFVGVLIDPAEKYGCRNVTHAEANAIAFAARQGISTDGAKLYVTVSPCDVCARLIIAAGIVAVYWEEAYRDESGLKLLEEAGLGGDGPRRPHSHL